MKKVKIIYCIFNLIITLVSTTTLNSGNDCDLTSMPDALSAYTRAQTNECKQEISDLACNYHRLSNKFQFNTKCNKSSRKLLVSTILFFAPHKFLNFFYLNNNNRVVFQMNFI